MNTTTRTSLFSPRRRALGAASLALGLALAGCSAGKSDAEALDIAEARAEFDAGRAVLIDIRKPDEHATGVIAGARLLPMGQIGSRLAEIPKDAAQPVLLICRTQNRSRATASELRAQGYTNVRYVKGGMNEWMRQGLPLVKPAS